jgi:hypothetical protein
MMGLRKRGRWHSGALVYWCFSIAIAAPELGCGSSADSPAGSGGSGNDLGSGGSTSTSTPTCDGAFAKVPLPYSANTSFDDISVFAVDEQGLIFSALPDDHLAEDTSDLPTLLMASDLQGNVRTVREAEAGFFSNLVVDGDDLIFTEGFFGRRLVRMSRNGGSETVLAEDVRAGAFADESSLYYFGSGDNGTTLFSLSRAGGLAKVMADRGRIGIRGFAFEGDTLYWGEEPPTLSNEDVSIYRMKVDATEPTLIAKIPSDTAGSLAVSGGVVFSTLITDSFDIRTFRVDAGKAPFPLGETGTPFILADGRAYYGGFSGGGVIRNTLNFDAPTTLSGTSGKSIYALAAGASDLWYATLGCVFRTSK